MVLLNRWPHVVFDNPVILYPSIHNYTDSVTSTLFHSLEYVYILRYILFLHLFHIFTSYIFPCWQLTIKLYCFQRFGLSIAFLLSPTYFSHSLLLPWRWRQQNSQKCSSMVSYLWKRIHNRGSHSEMEIDISKKFKSQEHVCLQTSVKFNSLSRIRHQLCALIIPHQRQNQSCKFPVSESYTLQARQNIGIVSQTERVNVH